ncbi:MAG: hypothetical protein ABII27_05800 [bacterium]
MLLNYFNNNGKKVVYGKCSYDELESMNVEQNFDAALNTLYHIRRSRRVFFGVEEPDEINRKIYGKRKASRE